MLQQTEPTNMTMQEVAKRLNLSISTVSRAFTRPDLVNLATKERIEQLCKQVNYRPNLNARAIATQKTNIIGFVSHNISRIEQFESIAYQLEKIFYQNGYRLQIELGHDEPAREQEIVETMIDRKVDGIIFGSRIYAGELEALDILLESKIPFVVMGYYNNPQVSQVVGDFRLAAKSTVAHLLELKHKRIGFLSYAKQDPRLLGYKQAHSDYNLEVDDELCVIIDGKFNDVERALDQLLAAEATAVFVMHDVLAADLYRQSKRKGAKIPQDLSIAAISTGQQTDIWDPPLTVFQLFNDNYAYSLSSILLEKINDRSSPAQHVYLGGELKIRNSARLLN